MATVLSACWHQAAVQTLAMTELVTSSVVAAAGTVVESEPAQLSQTCQNGVSVAAAAHNHSRTLLLLLLVFRLVLESVDAVVVAAARLVNTVYSNYRDNNRSVAANTTHAAVPRALAVYVVVAISVTVTLEHVAFVRAHMLSLAVLAMFSVSLLTLHVALRKQTEGPMRMLMLQLKIDDLRSGRRELG